jgi:hypothetical protein
VFHNLFPLNYIFLLLEHVLCGYLPAKEKERKEKKRSETKPSQKYQMPENDARFHGFFEQFQKKEVAVGIYGGFAPNPSFTRCL